MKNPPSVRIIKAILNDGLTASTIFVQVKCDRILINSRVLKVVADRSISPNKCLVILELAFDSDLCLEDAAELEVPDKPDPDAT